jgi:hypothetical protein
MDGVFAIGEIAVVDEGFLVFGVFEQVGFGERSVYFFPGLLRIPGPFPSPI